jgi:LEA14-like dessication related protein
MKRRTFVALALAALALAGCEAIPPKDALPPEIELSNVRFVPSGLFSQDVELELRLKNPNDFSLPLDALTYRLDVNDGRLVEGRSDQNVTIPKLGDALYPIKASTNVLDLLDQVLNFSASSVSYHITGVAYLGRFFPEGVPYDKSGRIRLLDRIPGDRGGSGGKGAVRTLAPL